MRNQIALLTTVAALAVTPALAQTSTQDKDKQPAAPQAQPSTPPSGGSSAQSPSTSSPSATSPSKMEDKSATSPSKMEDKSAAAPKAGAGEKFVNTQASGQWLASDIMGMNVVGSKDEKIGSVSDLLVDPKGNILAAVVGVGGFLGIGQKNVAITFDTLNISADKDGDPQAKLTLTKEELENAPEFKTAAAAKSEAQRKTSPSPATKPAAPRN
jgi:sporulation protein YlmC with PRC-barrel domain